MSIFAKTGLDVQDSFKDKPKQEPLQKQDKIDFKKLYINLADGESVNLKILGPSDLVEYKSHGEFSLGLYNQTCTHPDGKECAYCEAVKYAKENGLEDWAEAFARSRFLFAFYDLDMKQIRLFNATKNQAKNLFSSIQEYKDHLSSVSFKLSRSGNKTETVYTLAPQLTFKTPELKAAFDSVDVAVTPETFSKAIIVRSYQGQIKHLKTLKFPTEKVFASQEDKKVEISEDTLPF